MRLLYVSALGLPTKKAFGYAMAKMAESFSKINPVVLVAPGKNPSELEKIYDFYQIERTFALQGIPYVGFKNWFFLKKFTFYLGLLFFLKIKKDDFAYTRDLLSLLILRCKTKNVFLELHYLSRLDQLLSRLIFLAKKIIVITSFLKAELIKHGYSESRILVAPDAVDLQDFAAITETKLELRVRLNLPLATNIVLYTGNLFAWKGVYELALSAVNLIDSTIVFVGGSDEELVVFKNFVAKNQLTNVLILGYRPHQEIASFLQAADVLVLPNSGKESISKFNTSPLKLFEYLAAGVPIVASDLPSLREILNEQNSVLTKPDNVVSLSAGIKKVLEDKKLGVKLALQAKCDVIEYTWDKRAAKILDFLFS